MRLRPEARVGLVVLLALIALGFITVFFEGVKGGTYNICAVFSDAVRLADGADVRMAGVLIGRVSTIDLTTGNRARVTLRIANKYKGKIPGNSTARITTGGVMGVGDYYVEIVPGNGETPVQPGQCIRSIQSTNFDALLAQVEQIVGGLNTSVRSVNSILTDKKTRQSLDEIIENLRITTATTANLTADVDRILAHNEPQLNAALDQVNLALADFGAITREFRGIVESGSAEDIKSAISSASKAAANLESATGELNKLAKDQQIQAQLRSTIKSADEAAKGAAEIVNKVNKVISNPPKIGGFLRKKELTYGFPPLGAHTDVYGLTDDSGPFRVDQNYAFATGPHSFVNLGLFNFGENTKLNAEYGKVKDEVSAFRYGLYASKLAVGYDRRLNCNTTLAVDLYRPNDPMLEAKIKYNFSPQLGVVFGSNGLFTGGGAMVGIQYKK